MVKLKNDIINYIFFLINYQIMTAEGTAKRKKSLIPWNISNEIGALVLAKEDEYLIYKLRMLRFNQIEAPMANAAPT